MSRLSHLSNPPASARTSALGLSGTISATIAVALFAGAAPSAAQTEVENQGSNAAESSAAKTSVEKFKGRGPDYDPKVGSPEDQVKLNEIRQLINAGRIQDTIDRCIELIESGNRQGETLFIYGRALSLAKLPGRASWTLDAAMEDPMWIVPAAHQLAQDNYQAANFEIVIQVLDRLEANRLDTEVDDFFAMVLRGRAYLGTRQNYEEALEVFEEVLALQPDHEEALRLKGVALLGLKRTDEAWEIIEQGREKASESDLALGATDREAYWCAIQVTFNREAGKTEEAEKILEACLADYPTESRLIKEASDLYGRRGQYEKLVDVMRTANEAAPDDIELRQALVLQLRALGRRDQAEAVLRKTVENTPGELAGEPLIALAGFLVDSDRLDEGLETYKEASKRLGGGLPPEVLFSYAEALILAERFDEARAVAEQTPIEVHRPMIRGRVAYESGDYELAQKELSEAAKLWPDNAPIRYYLARTAEGLGDFSTAIEEYRQSMRSDATLTASKERLARLHLAEGRVRHAMSILRFSGAEASGTPSPDSRLIEIEIQAMLGADPDLSRLVADPNRPYKEIRRLAVEGFARGVRIRSGPEAVVEAMTNLAEGVDLESQELLIGEHVFHLILLDRTEEAETFARASVKKQPKSDAAKLALARALIAQDLDSKEGLELLRGIVSRQSDDPEARTTLGELELRAGNNAKAETLFSEALAIEPDHAIAMAGLAQSMVALGREAEAREQLEAYLRIEGPYDGQAALQLAKLIEDNKSTLEERIELTKRALRFGAGQPAIDFLVKLDPSIVPPEPPKAAGPGELSESHNTPPAPASEG